MSVKLSTKGIDFDVFCTLLGVLPTGQYHKLFNLYDREGGGYIDMKVRPTWLLSRVQIRFVSLFLE